MARGREQHIEHLLRRAAFGAVEEEVTRYAAMPFNAAVDRLLSFERFPDDVDAKIGTPGYVGVTARAAGGFQPRDQHQRRAAALAVPDGAQPAPAAGEDGALLAQPLRHRLHQDRRRVRRRRGHAHAWRPSRPKIRRGVAARSSCSASIALGNFRDLLVEVAKDPAMLVWLDGRTNVRGRPQENFAPRADGAVHDGRRHTTPRPTSTPARACSPAGTCAPARGNRSYYAFIYNAGQHDTDAKEFTFPIYPNGSKTIPARSAAQGMQDGIDLIDALARHPATGPRLARKLYRVLRQRGRRAGRGAASATCRASIYDSGFEIKPVVCAAADRRRSSTTSATATRATRGRSSSSSASLKEVGWNGFSVNDALTPLVEHGAAALRAAGRHRLGARAAAGSRRRRCWRG